MKPSGAFFRAGALLAYREETRQLSPLARTLAQSAAA